MFILHVNELILYCVQYCFATCSLIVTEPPHLMSDIHLFSKLIAIEKYDAGSSRRSCYLEICNISRYINGKRLLNILHNKSVLFVRSYG